LSRCIDVARDSQEVSRAQVGHLVGEVSTAPSALGELLDAGGKEPAFGGHQLTAGIQARLDTAAQVLSDRIGRVDQAGESPSTPEP
jgi:hypothetical protein